MTECLRCGAKAHNAYLCPRCTTAVRQVLTDLPWWLDRLTEAAIGQTRMSDNGGRRSARRKDLDGEKSLAECIEAFPDDSEADLEKARKARAKAALAHALASGGVNARASELLAEIADSLGYWCRVLCEHRGIPMPVLRSTPRYAQWLALHIHDIAATDSANDIATDIEGHLDDIVATVNRPIRIWYLGQCPAWDDKHDRACGADLRAPEGALETYCPRCHCTHSVNRLFLARIDEAERQVVTFKEILSINRGMPADYRIAPRTLQHWRTTGLLRAHQWQRPDGRKGLTQHHDEDVPLYSWADVKRLRLRKPQKATTGAAAHRRGG